jgi:hypothetical protein
MVGRLKVAVLAAVGCALSCSGAVAPAVARPKVDEVALTRVLEIAKPYPNLVQQVRLALIRAGVKGDAVSCTSRPAPAAAPALAGRRTGPYECRIGARRVHIVTRIVFTDRSGRRLDASEPASLAKAATFDERGLKWSWR